MLTDTSVESWSICRPTYRSMGAQNTHDPFNVVYKWFESFVLSADSMPDCGTKTLPSCSIKMAVYNIYKEQSAGKPLLARTTFIYSLWKAKFPHVIIPKVSLT